MPTREQVRQLLDRGLDYRAIGRELRIPAGQEYMIATGVSADGSDSVPDQEMEFDEHVEQFVMQVREHVAFEEQVFLEMREAMSQHDLDCLGKKLSSAGNAPPRRAPKGTGTGKGKPERSPQENEEGS